MRLPQIIIAAGLVVMVLLLLTPQRHPARYSSATEMTIHGTVTEARDFYCPISGHEGTHLSVSTASGIVEVHVAPVRFLAEKQWQFYRGDTVDVSGSRILFHGHDALIARTIARGNQTVALRDTRGKPFWTE